MIEQKKRIAIHNGSKNEALILKVLLESFSIQVFEDSSLMSVFNPWGISIGNLNSVKLWVNEDVYAKAKEIISDYKADEYNL
ncbi:hypothetical protein [Flavobacterium humidisoli]|uniref:DUF2007 domain-containing protein n=1 Tax=Flavobacterium humidisoli TaxID=2937442 RepID=A0ABY4LY21_9FLAO|nr:hypothetical protein [Flavobacterium humidisoli]UPZ18005.1 hypothetical protein M0M44_11800 [Flavobacterium humidisoli]